MILTASEGTFVTWRRKAPGDTPGQRTGKHGAWHYAKAAAGPTACGYPVPAGADAQWQPTLEPGRLCGGCVYALLAPLHL